MPPKRRLKCHRHANATFHNLVFSSTSRVSIRQTVANSFLFKLLFQINSFFCYLLRTICRFVWISCDSQLSIFFLYYFVSPFIIITSFLLHWAWQLWSQQLLGWQFLFLLFWNNLCSFIHQPFFYCWKGPRIFKCFLLNGLPLFSCFPFSHLIRRCSCCWSVAVAFVCFEVSFKLLAVLADHCFCSTSQPTLPELVVQQSSRVGCCRLWSG